MRSTKDQNVVILRFELPVRCFEQCSWLRLKHCGRISANCLPPISSHQVKHHPLPSPRCAKCIAPKSTSLRALSLTNNGALIACMTCSLQRRACPSKREPMTECGGSQDRAGWRHLTKELVMPHCREAGSQNLAHRSVLADREFPPYQPRAKSIPQGEKRT